jgi:hypothetical protein
MNTSEVLRRYATGERDFRRANLRGQSFKGKNLSGADFSEADIRGTNFTNAVLSGARFTGAKAGLQKRWVMAQLVIALVISLLSGVLSAFAGGLVARFFEPSFIEDSTIIPGIITLAILIMVFGTTQMALKEAAKDTPKLSLVVGNLEGATSLIHQLGNTTDAANALIAKLKDPLMKLAGWLVVCQG